MTDALQRLVDGLVEGLDVYAGRNVDQDNEGGNFKRLGVEQSLGAVIQYLLEINTRDDLRTPLLTLHGALADLDRGTVHPLLEKAVGDGRPKNVSKDVFDLAVASAAVELFRKDGDTLPDALRKASRHIGKTSAQLREWRKKLRQGEQRAEAKRMYDITLEDAEESGDTPGIAARHVVEFLKDKNPKA